MTPVHVVIASHNDGKRAELAALAKGAGMRVSDDGSGWTAPEESGATYVDNALLKARAAAAATGRAALADDSGVEVDALGGQPGLNTGRWAGPTRDFSVAFERLRVELAARAQTIEEQPVRFYCGLALVVPDGEAATALGMTHGELCWPPRGGPGFEAIFVPRGFACAYGEMSFELKQRVNARAQAFRLLSATLGI